jgi:hypothetical protein
MNHSFGPNVQVTFCSESKITHFPIADHPRPLFSRLSLLLSKVGPLHDAIAINNNAVQRMRDGSSDSALSELHRSIFLLRSLSEKFPTSAPMQPHDSSPSSPGIFFIPRCHRLLELQDDRSLVYNRPFALSKDFKTANPADFGPLQFCVVMALPRHKDWTSASTEKSATTV